MEINCMESKYLKEHQYLYFFFLSIQSFIYFLAQVKFLQPQHKVSKKMLKGQYNLPEKHSSLGVLYLHMCEHVTYIGLFLLLFQLLPILKLILFIKHQFEAIVTDNSALNSTGVLFLITLFQCNLMAEIITATKCNP